MSQCQINFVLCDLSTHLHINRQKKVSPRSYFTYSMVRTKNDALEEQVRKILNAPENSVMALYINKKVAETGSSNQLSAKVWMIRFFHKWCGQDILDQVIKNQRKMDTLYKYWSKHYFGYGLENKPSKFIANDFRKNASRELLAYDQKAKKSRDAYNKKQEVEVYSDDDAVDYYSSERIKLLNARTAKKNVAPDKSFGFYGKRICNPYVTSNKRVKFNSQTPRRVSDIHPPMSEVCPTDTNAGQYYLSPSEFYYTPTL